MDKCREEFEAWIIKSNATGRVPNFIIKNDNGAYVDPQTADLWIAWKASRESMKAIKLPDSKIYRMAQHGMTQMIDLNDTKDAIKSAGYKVEE